MLGIACLRGRLDWRLDAACSGWREADPFAFRIAAYVALEEGADLPAAAAASGLARERLEALASPAVWPSDPVDRLAREHSLPRWLAERWHRELGAGPAAALASAINRPGPVVLRTNALKTDRDGLLRALAEEGIPAHATALSPLGVQLEGRANLFGSQAWRRGLFEVQDEGSQAVALAVDARPGERCIDFCAGAGGKSLALAAAMRDQGEILALDIDPGKLINLAARAHRAGATILRTRRTDPDRPLPDVGLADRVLVDAPCSSLGSIRRSPDLRWRLRPEAIAEFSRTQLEILRRAAGCVRAGGLLVYATCTLTPEENDGVADSFAREHGGWRPEPLSGDGPLRLWPHLHGTDGFFACAWRRG
ncbi:MAG TPA: RsmB/NOP family class I SAM-dependent RNA methyltransferase [Myxococcales bacterium]